jgi:hypothetical protein
MPHETRELIPETDGLQRKEQPRQIRVTFQSRKNNTLLRLSAVQFYADEWSPVLNIFSICHIRLWICLKAAVVWKITTACTFHSRVRDSNDNSDYFRKKNIFSLNLMAYKTRIVMTTSEVLSGGWNCSFSYQKDVSLRDEREESTDTGQAKIMYRTTG